MGYKVTIAIPIFNTEPFIEKCLNSALNQTFESIEFLLLDDCSTDGTLRKVSDIVENSARKKHVSIIRNEGNLGIGAIRDLVFKTFQGDYLLFLDGDDELFLNSVEVLFTSAVKTNSDVVIGSIRFIDTLGRGRDGDWNLLDLESQDPADLFFNDRFYPMTWNKLYKRQLIVGNKVGCIPTNQEDEIISLQIFMYAKSVTVVSDITYIYYYRANSISSEFREDNFRSYSLSINYLKGLKNRFLKHTYYLNYVRYVYNLKFLMLWRLGKSSSVSEEKKKFYQREILTRFLSFSEIMDLPISSYEKLKFLLLFFPNAIVPFVLKNFSPFFKNIENRSR